LKVQTRRITPDQITEKRLHNPIRPVFTATFPSQPNPFYYGTNIQAGQVQYFSGEVIGWSYVGNKLLAAATVVDIIVFPDPDLTTITAVIRNDSADPLKDVFAAAWTDTNQSFPIYRNYIASILLPGEVITYTTAIPNLSWPVPPPVKVSAQGEVLP
jgi:hypothetical protein